LTRDDGRFKAHANSHAAINALLARLSEQSANTLLHSTESQLRITAVWMGAAPKRFVHGHMHVGAESGPCSARRVISLGRGEHPRNVGILELPSRTWSWLDDSRPAIG